MKNNKKRKGIGGVIAFAAVSVVAVALLATVTVLENGVLEPILRTVLGGPAPIEGPNSLSIYKSDYASKQESTEAGNKLNVKICEEGFVLLANENDALPIATPKSTVITASSASPKVSVFGHNSANLVLGGSGSGGLGNVKATTIFDGLSKGGFEVNPVLKEFYESSAAGDKRTETVLADSTSSSPTLDIGETPIANYTADVRKSFSEYSDAAIVVISRVGGESFDVPRVQHTTAGGIEGNHYLQLDQNEYDMLDMVTSRFDKVIVLLNSLTSFQCDFIAEYNNIPSDPRIDAVMWIGGPGSTGAEALGDLLNGNVSPSGRTTDLYAADFTADPVWVNFGDGSQSSPDGKNNSAFLQNGEALAGNNIITYEEGIYLGYRYYETRDYEEIKNNPGSTWYEDNVIFPFGYGLSYTDFTQEIVGVTGNLNDPNGEISIKVKVTNVGDHPGKEAVELYVHKPYIEGEIEKSEVELLDFGKTETLDKNDSQTLTFTFTPYDLASYDYNDANGNDFKGYELDAGDYVFSVSADSHVREDAYDSETLVLNDGVTFQYDPVTGTKVENRFTYELEEGSTFTGDVVDYYDIQYKLEDVIVNGEVRKGMSRTDFEGTFPHILTVEERTVSEELDSTGKSEYQTLKDRTHNNTAIREVTEMPTMGAKATVMLRDLLTEDNVVLFEGDDAYNAKWNAILDSLTFQEMLGLVNDGAFETMAIEKIGKNLTNDSDGPIGFVNFMVGKSNSYTGNTTFACEHVVGSTWNKDLAYQMGKIVGENGLWGDVNGNHLPYSGWYAPAINLHRSPFSGRNFEYYSSDPTISGKLAVNVINGAAQKGVYTDLKHFALNDQETNRAGVSTFCTEQALRELYLKPFETAVKGSDNPAEVKTAHEDGLTYFRGTTGIMTSFNRVGNRWTGGDYRLLGNLLREEWGFRGLAICDYKTDNSFMDSRQMVYAGNDLILTSLGNLMWTDADSSSAQDVTILRQAAKNILYAVANSNSIQIDIVGYSTEWWKTLTIVVDVVVPVGLAVWGFFAIRKLLKNKSKEESGE